MGGFKAGGTYAEGTGVGAFLKKSSDFT